MSSITVHREGSGSDHPPGVSGAVRRVVSLVVAVLIAFGTLLVGASPAQAGSHGAGYDGGAGFLGAYSTDIDGRQGYCIDLGAASPFGQTSGPQTVTSLDSLSRQQLAELNYVLARWGQSGDANLTAAVALYVWAVVDPGIYNSHGMSGDNYYVARAPVGVRGTILGNLAAMRQEASSNAVTDPSLSLGISMADQYAGTLTVSAHPASLQGAVTLSGARFGDGSTSRTVGAGQYGITGAPADGAPSYQLGASMNVEAAGYGAKVDLYTTGDAQRLLASGSSTGLSASAQTPVIELDFQPQIGTQVASRFVAEGNAFVDQLVVTVTKGTWTKLAGQRIPVTATGTLYGPFDEQPVEADTPPAGAPVAGTEQLTLAGTGDYASPGTITAPESGFYVWVWQIDKAAQGANSKYLTGSFTDRFGQVTESSVVPFQPIAVSTADQRLVVPGDTVTDTITVSSDNGAWLKTDGQYIPVVFEGTAYQVPGTLPPVQQVAVQSVTTQSVAVDPAAVPVGTVTITATGPGVYTSPDVVLPSGGFVTWVWEMKRSTQPDWVQDFLADYWQDDYGIPVETTSVRWPLTTTSLMREYNIHPNGRAFDIVTVTGFPANHGTFEGDGYWAADVDELVHTVYGPFATDSVLTDDLDLSDAPVLTTITTPARNGVYRLGYTDGDRVTPTRPGYYVLVTTFAGDDRVQPYQSAVSDVLERFYVPPMGRDVPVSVITQATPTATAGEPFSDVALIQGTTVPAGSYLQFRAYGPQPAGETPDCTVEPFYVSDRVPVTQAGVYASGRTSAETPGSVYWVETLYDRTGTVLVEGVCGAPGETTVVTETEILTVSTKAVAAVTLRQPARDTAIVTGPVPAGVTVTFDAYLQDGDEATCTDGEFVFTSAPVPVDGPGEYTSEPVVFEEVGVYYWVETLHDADGPLLHRGLCGAPDETTTVTAVPVVPPGPDVPLLALTGGGDWLMPAGIIAGVFALAGVLALWFGRRLAIMREREGYVREEDLVDIEDLFED